MSGNRELIYWDACIFLAHLKNEQRSDPLDMVGVQEQADRIDKSELHLVTSVITLIEVLEGGVPPDARNQLKMLFGRPNCHLIDVNSEIAEIAHAIRDFYRKLQVQDRLPTVTTPDAIHLATAIAYRCARFYTFDQNNQANKRRGLIPLSGVVAGQYNLIIVKPAPSGQLPMNFPQITP